MSEPVAIVTSTPELIGALRQRADALGLSRNAIDELAELAPGLASKTLSLCPSKGIGLKIVWGLIEAVGLKFALVECPDAMARIAEYVGKRDEKQVRKTNALSVLRVRKKARIERIFSDPLYFKKLGKKGGRARAEALDARHRQRIAMLGGIAARQQRLKRKKAAALKAKSETQCVD